MHHLLNATNIYTGILKNAAWSPTIPIYKHVKNMDFKGCSSK